MAAFTPGPWKDAPNQGLVLSETNLRVASTTFLDKRVEEQDANAQLIAAAPDLYAACRAMLNGWERDCSLAEFKAVMDEVRVAIAKAEGKDGAA